MEGWQYIEMMRRQKVLHTAFMLSVAHAIRLWEQSDTSSRHTLFQTLDDVVRERFDEWGAPLDDYQMALVFVELIREEAQNPSDESPYQLFDEP